MKTNTVPTITRKAINGLSRSDLNALERGLETLCREYGSSLTPSNRGKASAALNHTYKRKAQLKRSFFKNMTYKGVKNTKYKPRTNNWADYRAAMPAMTDDEFEQLQMHHNWLLKGEPMTYERALS